MVFYIVIPLKKLLLTLVKAQLPFQEKFVNVQSQATNVTHTKILIGAYIGLIALHIIYAKISLIALNYAAFASYAITCALILLRMFAKNFLLHLMYAIVVPMSIFVF
jgi:hypothetical protein